MSTSNKNREENIINKRSADPFDKLIFEKGIRIQQILVDKALSLLVILLNTGIVLKISLNHFPRLNNATERELFDYELIGDGAGIHWKLIDEDLSLKGLIKESALNEALHRLQSNDSSELVIL